MAKTKDLVLHRLNHRNFVSPVELPGIESVLSAKLIEVWLKEDLGIKLHINRLKQICNQHIKYLTIQLEQRGLPKKQLQCVFDAIIVSCLLYAAHAW